MSLPDTLPAPFSHDQQAGVSTLEDADALRNIRPMGLADILDGALQLYRRNFGPFIGIAAIAWLPAVLLQLLALYWMFSGLPGMEAGGADDPMSVLPFIGGAVGLAAGGLVIYLIAVPLAQGALIWAVSRRYLGKSISIAEAYRQVLRRLGHLLVAVILTGLATMVGTIFCIIPGIVLSFMFSFAVIEVVLEDRDGVGAMQRSWQLVSYDFWKVVGTLLVLGLLVMFASTALSAPCELIALIPIGNESATALMTIIAQAIKSLIAVLLQPVGIVGTILLYYDLRIRKEGFDIELLARAMGEKAPVARSSYTAGGSLLGPQVAPMAGAVLPPKLDTPPASPTAGAPPPPPPEYTRPADEVIPDDET